MIGEAEYCISRPEKPVLVKQSVQTMYFDNAAEALYAVLDTSLIELEWVPVASWNTRTTSTSTSATTCSQPIETKHVVTSNNLNLSNLTNALNFPNTFNGLFISFNDKYKSFRSQETVQPTTINVDVAVPDDGGNTVVYQQRWKFSTNVWFMRDHSGTAVGGPVAKVQEFTIESYIDSGAYMICVGENSLPSSLRDASIAAIEPTIKQSHITPFAQTSEKCRKMLLGFGAS